MKQNAEQSIIDAKYPKNTVIYVTKFAFLVLFFLSLLFGRADIKNSLHIISYVLWFGSGFCLSVIAFGYTYYAWTLDAKNFTDWYANQKLFIWQSAWVYLFPEFNVFRLWLNRLIDPLGVLAGVATVFVTLFIMVSS
jgi:hypothetical protein